LTLRAASVSAKRAGIGRALSGIYVMSWSWFRRDQKLLGLPLMIEESVEVAIAV
jgi:hypothetical protein